MNTKKLLISLLILLAGAGVTALVFLTEPEAKPGGATKKTAMLVETVPAESGTYRPTIIATGTVQPSRDIMLAAQVSGRITGVSPDFMPGGTVKAGERLLQINPADYENTLRLRQSELRQAQANLKLEQGRQDVARQDYQLIGDSLSGQNEDLVLRRPQLETARAQVEAAEAAVAQAQLNLERCRITAPFDAQILRRNANLGSQVAPGQMLGRLVGVATYWVSVTVPLSKINRLQFSEGNSKGTPVRLRSERSWPEGTYREGELFRLIGALEEQTRLARVLVAVSDPLARQNDSLPPLIVGAFVEAEMEAEPLRDVVRLSRDYLRKNGTVWVMDEAKKLRIREVNIAFEDTRYAYIRDGLQAGEQVVTTNLATVVDGSPLRTQKTSDNPKQP